MRVGTVMRPGQPGTRKLQAKYGERLLAVRYRYDKDTQQRYTTVKLVEDSVPWKPGVRHGRPPNPDTVAVRVDWSETVLRQRVAQAGGRWDANRKLWFLPLEQAKALQLMNRAIPVAVQHAAGNTL